MVAADNPIATQLIDAARSLAPQVRAYADEAERQRRLPLPLVQELKAAGLLRLWLPEMMGGYALDPLSTMRVLEEVAQADASVGWCVMIAAAGASYLPYLDQEVVARVFHHDDIFAGTLTPIPTVAIDGGYRATGRSTFASGCTHATWIIGNGRIMNGEHPRTLPDGTPERRWLFFPASNCEILDTWHTTGLRGTGSHDYQVTDVFVPHELASGPQPVHLRERWGGPLYRGPFIWPMRGAMALGIARHAIDALIEMASTKKPFRVRETLRDLPRVQAAVARAEASQAAVRAYLYDTVAAIWEAVRLERELSRELETRRGLATAYTAESCLQIVESMYRLAGGTAIYITSPLERCFRDINTLMADQAVAPRVFEEAGRIYLGVEPPPGAP